MWYLLSFQAEDANHTIRGSTTCKISGEYTLEDLQEYIQREISEPVNSIIILNICLMPKGYKV